jgi:hypothetical protein
LQQLTDHAVQLASETEQAQPTDDDMKDEDLEDA